MAYVPFYPQSFVIRDTSTLTTGCVDHVIFTAPFAGEVLYAYTSQVTPDTDSGTVTVQLRKCTTGQAIASGTALFATAQSVKTTANTPVAPALVFTPASKTFKQGDRLAVDFSGVTDLAGFNITVLVRQTSQGF